MARPGTPRHWWWKHLHGRDSVRPVEQTREAGTATTTVEERATMTEARQDRRTPGTPCWVSPTAHNLATTQEFYGSLFGWEFVAALINSAPMSGH